MLTSEFKDKNKNNESASTFLGNPSMKQQMDCWSGLRLNGGERESVIKTKQMSSLPADNSKNQRPGQDQSRTQGNATIMTNNDPAKATLNSAMSKNTKNKKQKISIYNEIDRDFFNIDKPTDPLQFIDNTKQKVMINPGVPYVSTSQNEIFERRILLNQKEYLNKINPFIAAPQDDVEVGIYEGQEEESYI